jgi:hypothetical protein
MTIEIRRFREREAPLLMAFIDEHWERGHALATNRALLDWQYRDGDEYAVFGAWQADVPVGVLGYIPTRRFDAALAGSSNVTWLALWKVRDDVKSSAVGLRLLSAVAAAEPSAAVGVVGFNATHPPLYKALGYTVGELRQYAVFHPTMDSTLAVVPRNRQRPRARAGRAELRDLSAADLERLDAVWNIGDRDAVLPKKTSVYFRQRYAEHPWYRYRVSSVRLDGESRGVLVTRIADHQNRRALRIVDWYGDPSALGEIGSAVERRLIAEHAEYADFWQHGIDGSCLTAAGFESVDPDGDLIVPTYFEPFVQQNQRLLFAIRPSRPAAVVVVRGDGDQDRPNLVPVPAEDGYDVR